MERPRRSCGVATGPRRSCGTGASTDDSTSGCSRPRSGACRRSRSGNAGCSSRPRASEASGTGASTPRSSPTGNSLPHWDHRNTDQRAGTMGSRFVRPSTRTLTLANGDTLTVKRRLSSGEQRAAFARMYLTGADGALSLNTLQTGMAIITAYLVNWSLTDDDGQHVDIAGLSTDAL